MLELFKYEMGVGGSVFCTAARWDTVCLHGPFSLKGTHTQNAKMEMGTLEPVHYQL